MKLGSYGRKPLLKSYGANVVTEKLESRYGEEYLQYRKKWALAENLQLPAFPLNVVFDLIDACTLKCHHCLRSPDLSASYSDYIGTGKKLSTEDVIRVMDECYEHKLPSVNIGGSGECMMHPSFIQICIEIMKRGILELRVTSNGSLLTTDISEALIDQQVHFLSISLDAYTAETYGIVRGKKEKFDMIIDNIMKFMDLRQKRKSIFPMLRVSFVRQQSNYKEADRFVEFWSQYADLIDIQPFVDYRAKEYNRNFSCNEPWFRLYVCSDGHVVPCCGYTGLVFDLGNITNKSLLSIWEGDEIKLIREMLLDKKFPDACLKCRGALVDKFDEA